MIDYIKQNHLGIIIVLWLFISSLGGGEPIVDKSGIGSIARDTTTITNPHNFTQGMTGTTGSFSGTLSVTGATTLSGAVTLKEKTASSSLSDTVLTNADSFTTTYFISVGATTTLPAVATASGTYFKFVIAGAFTTNDFVVESAEGDNIEGTLIVNGAVVDCAAEDNIHFLANGENIGDFFEIRSDGTSWLIGASGGLSSGKMICIDPS